MPSDAFLAMVDAVPPYGADTFTASGAGARPGFAAAPYICRDPALIPPRQFLHGRHLIRKFVSVTAAAGGVGKTALGVAHALEMVTGRRLVSDYVSPEPLRVWLYNLEDPADELERRIAAAMVHHGIHANQIANRLFLNSGRDQPMCIASEVGGGSIIHEPLVESIVSELTENKIDVLTIDPFVSSHSVSENDNGKIDAVAKTWGRIAERANCAIELVHHLRKLGDNEATAEHARGGVALIGAARSVRILNRMTESEGTRAGVDNNRQYFRAMLDKANLAPPPAHSDWYQLVNVDLANGDKVGVVEGWAWPDAMDGLTVADLLSCQHALEGQGRAENIQARDWAGYTIATTLGLDASDPTDRQRIKEMMRAWIRSGALRVERIKDEKKGRERPTICVGNWADE